MLDILEAYLDASTTPELRDLVMDSCKTLEVAGVDQHLFQLRNLMDGFSTREFNEIYDEIFAILKTVFVQTLREFGIQLDEDVDLRTINSILKGIQAIPNWDDPDTLNGLTDPLEGNEAALADILTIVGDLSIGDYMQALTEVSTDLLQRIAELTNSDRAEPQPDSVNVAAAQMRLRQLLPKVQFGEDSIFVDALDNGLRLGLSFEMTLAPYLDALHDCPVHRLAGELVAFAYASTLATDVVPTVLDKLKESFTLSIPDMIQLDADIKRLL